MEKLNMGGGVWRVVAMIVLGALLATNTFILTGVKAEVHDINTKLFNHLINAELHVPRSQIVSKSAFDMYKMFKDGEKATIIQQISDMKKDLIDKIDDISVSRR